MIERRIPLGDGVVLAVDLAGDAGPPILLLHGFPQSARVWRPYLEPLVEEGFRAIAPDMRGYGRSDKPHDVSAYRGARLVDDLVELVRALGHSRVHVVGHDWGGVVAWMFAARHPELVDRLVILNGPHPSRMRAALMKSGRQRRRSWYIFAFQLPWVAERMLARPGSLERILRGSSRRPEVFSDEDVAHYQAAVESPDTVRGMLAYYRAAARYLEKPLPVVERPTLVLWGMEDEALGPELLDGLEKHVRDLRIERYAGVSHWIVDEEPERVREAIVRFCSAKR